MTRKKYWLLTTEYPPFHGGGISTYCEATARMLAALEYDVTVFVNDEAVTRYTSAEKDHVRVIRFSAMAFGAPQSLGHAASLSYAFAQVVRTLAEEEGKPDVIESQDYLGIAYYLTQFRALGYAFVANVPIVLTLHSPAFVYLEYNRVPTYAFPEFWTCEMEKHSLAAADLILSPTQFMADEVARYMPLPEERVRVVPNPFQAPFEASRGGYTPNRIVYYGKLSAQKGTFALLEYFRELWDNGFGHSLHLVGGTDIVYHPEMKTMEELVLERYRSYVDRGLLAMHGKILPSAMQQYLQDAHVVVFPSLVDNLPYVVMEAMSLGKVVLASAQGGQREIIEDGVSGFIFDHHTPGSFAAKLNQALTMTSEGTLAMGDNARKRVADHYSFERIGNLKHQILSDLLNRFRDRDHFPFLYQEKPVPVPATSDHAGFLSVVIPYFNMGDYIEEALDSVFASSWPTLEVLVINDGSTEERSLKKLEELRSRYPVRIVNRKNQGLAATRNYGARIAKGEFLAFLDADDAVEKTYFEKAIRALRKNKNVSFAGAWVQYFGNSSKVWPTFTPQPPYILVHNSVNSSGLVYKRSAFLAGGQNDAKVDYGLEDYESVVSMMRHGLNGVVLPETLFCYRVRSGSMFRKLTNEKFLYAYKYLSEKHAGYYSRFALPVMHLLNANGPGYRFDNPTQGVRVVTAQLHDSSVMQHARSFIKRHQQLKKIALIIKRIKH